MSNKTFTIKLEFTDVSSESPLDATKTILSWIKDGVEDMTYDVKDEATGEAFTVDLAEEDEDAVLPNDGIEELKIKHEKIRQILIDNGCEEFGDNILDEISLAVGIQPTTFYYEEGK